MPSLNKVFLMGNLTRDPELRYTPNGTAVCDFGLAINRTWQTADGKKREETCFVDCTMWGRRGEVVAEHFRKGKPIFIEGRLQFDQWESKDGQKRNKLKVVADNFEFIGGRDGQEQGQGQQDGGQSRQGQSSRQAPAAGKDYEDVEKPPDRQPQQSEQKSPNQPQGADGGSYGDTDTGGDIPF